MLAFRRFAARARRGDGLVADTHQAGLHRLLRSVGAGQIAVEVLPHFVYPATPAEPRSSASPARHPNPFVLAGVETEITA